jgi:thiol:disulfide interchange protein DsbC
MSIDKRERVATCAVMWGLMWGLGACGVAMAEQEVPPVARMLWPDLAPAAVQSAPMSGWMEIVTPEGQVAYLDPTQRYVVLGQAIDLWTRRNLTTERLERERVTEARALPERDLLWVRPEGAERKGRIFMFTDPDCPYCREVHPRLKELAAAGVEIGVVLYPIPRLHPAAYGKSVGIWCATDQLAELDRAMRGDPIDPPAAPCDHPVDRNIRLGRRIGVTGTPYWLSVSGQSLAGVRSVEDLLSLAGVPSAPTARRGEEGP